MGRQVLPCFNATVNEWNVMGISTRPDKTAHIEVWERQSDAKCNPQDKTETNSSGDTIGQRKTGRRNGFGGVFSSSFGAETTLCAVLVTLASLGPIQCPTPGAERGGHIGPPGKPRRGVLC